MKKRAKRGKMAIKKWGFRGKMWVIGHEKLRVGDQLERLNGAKCRLNA